MNKEHIKIVKTSNCA